MAERHVYDLREANSNCRGDLHEWKSSKYTGKYSYTNMLVRMHYFLWFQSYNTSTIFFFNFYLPKLGGRPCIKSDCQLLELHLGSKFAAAQIGSGGGYAEISAAGGGSSGRSDLDVFNGWKNSPGHNEIMLTKDGEYPVFGCANFPPGEFAHCIFFSLDKKLPGGSFFIRDCA